MKRIMLNKIVIVSCLLTIGVFTSCENNLDLTDPSYPTTQSYYKNSSQLLKGTNAIYSILHSGSLVAREWFFVHDLRSDEVFPGGSQLEPARRQLYEGSNSPTNAVAKSVWGGLYAMIHRANVVITNGPNVTDNTALRDRCVGEAKFLRAWAYFELVSMWGPVPLYTKPVDSPDDFQPRAATDKVYAQIEQDLKDAAGVLLPSYSGADLGRVTSGAANAMLGKVYMQQLDFKTALGYFQKVENSGLYSLVDNYFDNFKEETEFNKESIFEVVFYDKGDNSFDWGYVGDGPNVSQGTVRNQEYCPVAWRNLIPSNKYLNNFEVAGIDGATKTDPRFKMSVYRTGDTFDGRTVTLTDAMQNNNSSVIHGTTIKASWRKYTLLYKQSWQEAQNHPGGGINQRLIRYAGVLLDMAECYNELNNIPKALEYINRVRDRPSVDMPDYPTAEYPADNKMDVVKIIAHEKMAELGCEEVRNIDLLRWHAEGYEAVAPSSLHTFKPNKDGLLAIPQQEIDNNPMMGKGGIKAQNPGY